MLSHNTGAILRKMRQRQTAVVRELTQAAREIGAEVSGESKKVLQEEVYDVPIPFKASATGTQRKKLAGKTTKGKAGAWSRTGNLKRQENFTVEGPTVVLRNNAKYAVARFNLGTASGRPIKSPGVQSVQWQVEAVANKRTRIIEIRRRALLRALSGGLV